MLPSLSVFLSLVVVFIGRVQATCNCSASVLPAACTCRVLMLSDPTALELICHGHLFNLTFLTSLSDEEKHCVQHLDVSGNAIHQIRASDLFGFENLNDLSLAQNTLDFIEEDVFMSLTSLERLNLSDNNIHQLPLVFRNLVNLEQLSLSRNNLTSFPDLHGLSSNFTTLHLDGNKITTINRTDFEPLEGLNNWIDLDLTGNPLICDCQLAWIVNWLAAYPVAKLAFKANCDGPTTEVTNRHVNSLKPDEFPCGIHPAVLVNAVSDYSVPLPTPPEEMRKFIVISSGGNVTLNCTATGIPTPSVQWRFKGTVVGLDEQLWFGGHKELQLTDVQLSAAGQYHCVAQNQIGVTEETVEVQVWPESDPPHVAACPEMPKVTPKGEFRLPQHNGLEKFLQQPCIEGPLCGVPTEDGIGVFKCFDGAWQVIDIQNCQYSDEATHDLQCLSVFSVNDSTVEWVAQQLHSNTIDKNMNYLQVNFAIETLESIMIYSNVLSSKAVEHIVYSISQLMAAPELSTGQTQANYTNRLSRVIHRIAHLEIDYGDASYMLSIDSPLLLFEVTSAVHLSQYVFNGSKQASVHLPASLLEPAELESSASGQVSAIQSYVSSPGNIAYMAQYKSDVLFQHGVVVQDSCQLDDCHKRWSGATVNAAVISVGTDKAADSLNETAVVNLVFESLQDAVDPLCVHWDYRAHGGKGGWLCNRCSLKSWINNKATCECTLVSVTYTLLMTNCSGTHSERCECRGVDRGTLANIGVISCYIAIVAALMALIVLFVSWLKSEKVSQSLQVKINIGLALVCVSAMYIVSVWPDRDNFLNTASCKTVSSLLHYFLTVLFLWIAADGYVAYTTLVHSVSRKSNDSEKKHDKFMIKAAIVCWGIPLLVIAVFHIIGGASEAANCYLYGSTVQIDPTLTNGEERAQVCWIKNNYVVVGVLAAPAFISSVASSFIYCYALARKSKNKDWQTLVSSLMLVLLLGLSWAFGLLTLTDHTEFSESTCKSYPVFYYFYGVCQSAAAVCLLVSSCFFTSEVQQAVKSIFSSLDDHQSSASESQSDVLSYLSSQQQLSDVQPKKKKEGLRNQKSSGYLKSGGEIPLETLNSLMPFSMDLRQHQVACPAKRESMVTVDTEGKAMTVATRSVGEGQSVASGFEEDTNLGGIKFVDMEKQEKPETQDEPEKTDQGGDDEEALEKKSVGYDGDESGGDTSDSCDKEKADLYTDSNIYSSVTQTQIQFQEDGVRFSDIVDCPPTPLVKQPHRDGSDTNVEVTTSMASKASGNAEEHQAVKKGHMDDGESESADKLTDLPPTQDTLARHIRELDDMLSISQASLQEFEDNLGHERPVQTVPPRSSHSVPSHMSHVVYPPHHRRNRSIRKLHSPTRPGAASSHMSPHDSRRVRYVEQPVVRNQEPMVVTEVHLPRRERPRMAPPGSHVLYDPSLYPEMYEARLVRRPPQAYYYQPRYYSREQHDEYRYRKPHHPNSEFFDPQQRPIRYYERRPPPRQYYQVPTRPVARYGPPIAYPHRYPPRSGRVMEYSYLTEPPHHSFHPAVGQRAARQSQATAGGGYTREKLDQLLFFPGTAKETKNLEEGLHGEDDDSAVGTWYDDQR